MCLRRTCTVLGDGVVCPSIVGLFRVQSVYATYFIIVFLSKIFAFDETWVPDPYCYCIIKSFFFIPVHIYEFRCSYIGHKDTYNSYSLLSHCYDIMTL